MKNLILFFLVIVLSHTSKAQQMEFTIHDNGLIYDESTMNRIGHIVDSLNIRFRTCDVKNYTSLPQGYATYFHISGDGKKAKEAIRKNVSPDEITKTFPRAAVRNNEWIIKSHFTNYQGEEMIQYFSLPLRNKEDINLYFSSKPIHDKREGWIYQEDEDGELSALYLENLKEQELPFGYARLVQYVDCLIDTTAQIYLTNNSTRALHELSPDSKITQFITWANDFEKKPQLPDVEWDSPFAQAQYEKYRQEYSHWNNNRIASLDEKMKKGHYFISLLMDAANEAIDNKTSSDELEFYGERYLSAQQALEMKRSRKPIGNCSMDQGPRIHAGNICRLAAETAQWDIFLRAHLDIMNDNFDRRSDGSYAWAGRGTYLKELEELHINAVDLLIGTCLRSGNVNSNHYSADIGRIGRALSETSHNGVLESRLLVMISDESLDLFNRLLMAYVFDNYNQYLKDDEQKRDNLLNFKTAVMTLPMEIGKTLLK